MILLPLNVKNEKASIGTPTVEAYFTKLLDVGAKHGAIVSNSHILAGETNGCEAKDRLIAPCRYFRRKN